MELADEDRSAARRRLEATMTAALPGLIESITTGVQQRVGAYAGPRRGRRHHLIRLAVSGAVHAYVRRVCGEPTSGAGVDDLFRRMGHGEALEGHDLQPMTEALTLATRDAWRALRTLAVELGITGTELADLGESLLDHMQHLGEQVRQGHSAGLRAGLSTTAAQRAELVAALLAGRPEVADELQRGALAPLADLRPGTRADLLRTLAAWLPTRPPAPDLARTLVIHPQTARRRLRRIRMLWGPALDDPDESVALLLAVRCAATGSVPVRTQQPAQAPKRRSRLA